VGEPDKSQRERLKPPEVETSTMSEIFIGDYKAEARKALKNEVLQQRR